MQVQIFLAKITSYLLHPILIFFYSFLFLLALKPHLFGVVYWGEQSILIVLTFMYTCVIPLIGISLLKFTGLIKSFHLRDRFERYAPLIICSIFYLWMWVNLKSQNHVPKILLALILASILAIFMAFIANIKLKISLHTLAMGTILCFWILVRMNHCDDHVFYFRFSKSTLSSFHLHYFIMCILLIAGWVGTSRLILNAHSPSEVYLGFGLGFLACWLAYSYTF